jgi:hypothetical protein
MDFTVENHGSIFILQPMSQAALDWVEDNLHPDHQTWAGGVVVEHRYIEDIVVGIQADGLEVR